MSGVAFARHICPAYYNHCLGNSSLFSVKICRLSLSRSTTRLPYPCSYLNFSSFSCTWPSSSYTTNASSPPPPSPSPSTSTDASPPTPPGVNVGVQEDVIMGYIFGKKKATQVAHASWKHIVRKGDVVIDATCGNGHDTLALLNLVADPTNRGRVYAMDIQKVALENTSLLLNRSLSPEQREHVELFLMCHSKMEEIIPNGVAIRLVAFNLGYLPRGEKEVITRSETTLLALEAAKRILAPGGLISIVVYLGHPGGREEFETVQGFASDLSVEEWVCCKFQTINRPFAPVVVLLLRK